MYTMRLLCTVDDTFPLLPPGGEFLPSRHADSGSGGPLSLAHAVRTFWQGQGIHITN